MKRLVLFSILYLFTLCPTVSWAESAEAMQSNYVAQEVGQYGPLDCGNTFIEFRKVTADEIRAKIDAHSRETLFATQDGQPYPFRQIYIDDLIRIRDLMRVDDDAHKAVWDERIKAAATTAYERIMNEGRLR
jgi:hypothetical protein